MSLRLSEAQQEARSGVGTPAPRFLQPQAPGPWGQDLSSCTWGPGKTGCLRQLTGVGRGSLGGACLSPGCLWLL